MSIPDVSWGSRDTSGLAHDQIHRWVTDGADPAALADARDRHAARADELRAAGRRLETARAALEQGWAGRDADAASDRARGLGDRMLRLSDELGGQARSIEGMRVALERVRAAVGPPRGPGLGPLTGPATTTDLSRAAVGLPVDGFADFHRAHSEEVAARSAYRAYLEETAAAARAAPATGATTTGAAATGSPAPGSSPAPSGALARAARGAAPTPGGPAGPVVTPRPSAGPGRAVDPVLGGAAPSTGTAATGTAATGTAATGTAATGTAATGPAEVVLRVRAAPGTPPATPAASTPPSSGGAPPGLGRRVLDAIRRDRGRSRSGAAGPRRTGDGTGASVGDPAAVRPPVPRGAARHLVAADPDAADSALVVPPVLGADPGGSR